MRILNKITTGMFILGLLLSSGAVFSQDCQSNGISLQEYAHRREALLQKTDSNSVIAMKAKDAFGEFDPMNYRQEMNFFYLTGLNEPGIILLMSLKGIDLDGIEKHVIFFAPSYSDLEENKAGYCNSTDTVMNSEGFSKILDKSLSKASTFYYSAPDMSFVNDWFSDKPSFIITEARKTLKQRHPGLKVKDVAGLIKTLRLIKSPAELELMQKAIDMTVDGIRKAMKMCRAGLWEYQLQAAIESEMTGQGAETRAFSSIIGSGENNLILHYSRNSCQLKNGDLVVMDVGAQYQGYAADITRTIPVSGKFTKEQEEVYSLVLRAQEEAIKMIRPGVTMANLDKKASSIFIAAGYRDYTRHSITHPVGLDVHDVMAGDTLAAGMVITIEPGLYIPVDDNKLPAGYHGFGVRIEDDVLVTKDGYEVLSKNIPKEIAEIEKIMK